MGTFSKLCDLIMEASASNYTAKRNNSINKATPHHVAGCLTAAQIAKIFQNPNRKASANYGIGIDGKIVGIVPEEGRAYTSSSPSNDHQAITIEVANDQVGGDWHVSDLCIERLIDLMVDIRKRTGATPYVYDGTANGTVTRHNMFAATACPGKYLQSKFPYITEQVNKRLQEGTAPVEVPTAQAPTTRKVGDVVTVTGIYVASNSTNRLNPARTSGTITKIIPGAKNPYLLDNGNLGWTNDGCIVDNKITAPTTNTSVTTYTVQSGDCLSVIGEKLGVNWKEIASLNGIHSPYTIYKGQKLKIPTTNATSAKPNLKSDEEICKEVWQGKWGNGGDRAYRLTQAGYDAARIQKLVNQGVGK